VNWLSRIQKLSRPAASSRVIIIDPGCLNRAGHHARLNRLLADHYRQSDGRELRILVHKECEPDLVAELGAEPVLLPSIYIGMPDKPEELEGRLDQRNGRLREELLSHAGEPRENDTVIVHSITVWTLSGLTEWLSRATSPNMSARIILMFPPSLDFVDSGRQPSEDEVANLETEFNEVIRRLGGLNIDLRLATESKSFAEHLSAATKVEIETLSLPIEYASQAAPHKSEKSDESAPLFFFPGAGRAEKGFYNLPGAIRTYQAAGGRGRFLIQYAEDENTAAELRALPNVEILGRLVFGADYLKLMTKADAIIAAYDPARYALRAGHIVVEALGSGRPVIVTRGTWMEEIVASLPEKCGVVAESFSPDALGHALLKFDENQSELSKSASEIASTVRKSHSKDAFLENFLS